MKLLKNAVAILFTTLHSFSSLVWNSVFEVSSASCSNRLSKYFLFILSVTVAQQSCHLFVFLRHFFIAIMFTLLKKIISLKPRLVTSNTCFPKIYIYIYISPTGRQ